MAQQKSNVGKGSGDNTHAGAASATSAQRSETRTADPGNSKRTADHASAKGTGGGTADGRSAKPKHNGYKEWFSRFAHETARLSGNPAAFIIAAGAVVLWAATGPLFHYSDTWQLVINTSTTIVTFLMVFLIQNTQNRDTLALQLKLSELVLAVNEAEDRVASAEDLSDDELETLHEELRARAEAALG